MSFTSFSINSNWVRDSGIVLIYTHIEGVPGKEFGLHELEKDGVRYLAFSTKCCSGYIYYKESNLSTYCSVCKTSNVAKYTDSLMAIEKNSNEEIADWLRLYGGLKDRKVERT